jgi:ABC-2 type transport system permease protein
MHGGKVLWLIDQVLTSMDSIQSQESTVAISNNLNLDDLMFKYGVRLNYNLVMDLNAMPIAIRTGQVGGQPQLNFFPWYYFPVITPISQHPIVKNLNAIKTQFVGSIDTVRAPGIRKTVLLKTSPYSHTVNTPAVISLGIIRQQPDESLYRGPSKITAVLMEGEFESFYRNRIPPEIANANEIGFSEYSKYTSMIFVSDGDMIRNQFRIPGGEPLPLGYDQYTRETFGNKDFILNAINYLVEGPELINLRTRELSLRLLDQTRVNNNKLQWQLINLLLPILLIALLGSILVWLRKQKYSR